MDRLCKLKNKKLQFYKNFFHKFNNLKFFFFQSIIVLVMGFYYSVFKAGIPYQDPTIELQIQYEIDYNIGNILTKIGSLTTACSGVIYAILLLLKYFLRKES